MNLNITFNRHYPIKALIIFNKSQHQKKYSLD